MPLHHAYHLAAGIPAASLRVCPGEGHMVMWSHLPEVLEAAAGCGRASATAA